MCDLNFKISRPFLKIFLNLTKPPFLGKNFSQTAFQENVWNLAEKTLRDTSRVVFPRTTADNCDTVAVRPLIEAIAFLDCYLITF